MLVALLAAVVIAAALIVESPWRADTHVSAPTVAADPAGSASRSPDGGAATDSSLPTAPAGLIINHGRRDLPMVALTFDSNLTASMISELDRHTVASFDNSAVIDELQSLDVPATFFLAGLWMERYPDEVRRLAADSRFELASHSYSHRAFVAHCFGLGVLPLDQMAADVTKSEQLLHDVTPAPTSYFRFPGTCASAAAVDAIRPTGVTIIGYDVASGDAFGHSVAAIVKNVVDGAKDGSIVVLHITGGNTAPLTAKALPAIVAGLRAKGFNLVRLSTLLAACPAGGCPQERIVPVANSGARTRRSPGRTTRTTSRRSA